MLNILLHTYVDRSVVCFTIRLEIHVYMRAEIDTGHHHVFTERKSALDDTGHHHVFAERKAAFDKL